jgi:hypothetical protein
MSPEVPAQHRIDPDSRLVEKQQARVVKRVEAREIRVRIPPESVATTERRLSSRSTVRNDSSIRRSISVMPCSAAKKRRFSSTVSSE